MNNVHMIGVPRKAGRRRERPLPDAPLADVVSLADRREAPEETAEDRADRYAKVMNELAHHLLMAVRALKSAPDSLR